MGVQIRAAEGETDNYPIRSKQWMEVKLKAGADSPPGLNGAIRGVYRVKCFGKDKTQEAISADIRLTDNAATVQNKVLAACTWLKWTVSVHQARTTNDAGELTVLRNIFRFHMGTYEVPLFEILDGTQTLLSGAEGTTVRNTRVYGAGAMLEYLPYDMIYTPHWKP